MKNYKEWKSETGEIIVEVYNESDLSDVQKIYIERGYYITWTKHELWNDHHFFAVYLADKEN